jgi:peptide-methionine (S)-S-oxide reductase
MISRVKRPAHRLHRALFAAAIAILGLSAANFPDAAAGPVENVEGSQRIVLAGGCFWGMEAVFEQLAGVSSALPGYAGGLAATAHYMLVSTGTTGHAESVQVTFDPAKISLGQLLKVYFEVAHDPTTVDRQGPDFGTQYRSAIFYTNPEQKRIAQAYIRRLDRAKVFPAPIATQVVPLAGFYQAEGYHLHYVENHPDDAYVVENDLPKLAALRRTFPALLRPQPASKT